ncbi:MAG: GGDEF domain-containing protein [Planctomycetota bacterium]
MEKNGRNGERKPERVERPVVLVCDHRGEGLAEEIAWLAERGYAVEITRSLRQSLLRLAAEPRPDLLLVHSLAGGGQVELAALDRRRNGVHATPLLVVSEPRDGAAMARVDRILRGGPWDLFRRGAPPEELLLQLRRLLEAARLVEQMDDLRHRAFHDDRTNLLRPLAFEARLEEHFSAAHRHHQDLAFVLIDLDRFGAINKEHDHLVGDALISAVGQAIRRTLRTEDVAGRLGGDEFGVLLPYTRKIDAAGVVNRLRNEITRLSGIPPGARGRIAVSASLGFETYDGHDLEDHQTLRRHAERALRVAKTRGGNQAVYYRSLPEAAAESAGAAGSGPEGAPPGETAG